MHSRKAPAQKINLNGNGCKDPLLSDTHPRIGKKSLAASLCAKGSGSSGSCALQPRGIIRKFQVSGTGTDQDG